MTKRQQRATKRHREFMVRIEEEKAMRFKQESARLRKLAELGVRIVFR